MKAMAFKSGTLAAILLCLFSPATFAGPFVPGEILLDQSGGSSGIQRYSGTGMLLQAYTGTGLGFDGAALTPTGNLATAYRSGTGGIDIFSPAGTQIATFNTGTTGAEDLSVFANGTLALNVGGTNTVRFYSQAGSLLGTTTMTGGSKTPLGSTVGTDNVLYVADNGGNKIARVDQTGAFLGTLSLSFSPGDLVMSPLDGTLWVTGASDDNIYHLTTTGTVLSSFPTGFTGFLVGIGLAADGSSLYASMEQDTVIRHFSLTGAQLGDFAITNPNGPIFMTVVPLPEPGSAVLLAIAGAGLLLRRRRQVGRFAPAPVKAKAVSISCFSLKPGF